MRDLFVPFFFCAAGCVLTFLWMQGNVNEFVEPKDPSLPLYKIALMTDTAAYHGAVNEGFFAALNEDNTARYQVDFYYSQQVNPVVMHQCAQAVWQKDYDAVVTVGSLFTQYTCSVLKKRKSTIPVTFIGVAKPVDTGCIESEERPGGRVTGLRAEFDEPDMIARVLYSVFPSIKRVVVLYDTTIDQGKQQIEVDAMAAFFEKQGVEMIPRVLQASRQSLEILKVDLRNYAQKVDAVVVLEGSFATLDYPGIARLCERNKVILCAGDPMVAIEGGAPLAFGPEPQYAGRRGFLRMRSVLRGEIDPATTPIERITNARRIVLNTDVCQKLGFDVDPAVVYMLKRGLVCETSAAVRTMS